MKVAKGHQPLMPYLILEDAEAFILFTKRVFNATEIFKSYHDEKSTSIAHAEVQINGCNIMFANVTADFKVANANLFIYVDDADQTVELALQNDATIINEVADQSYGRSGGIQDPFGNVWWVTSMK